MTSSRKEKLIPMRDNSALVMDDGKIYKIQQKRQRQILSCVACHKRKIKCDRQKPSCGSCVKNGWECTYFVNARVSRGGNQKKEMCGTTGDSHSAKQASEETKTSKEELLRVIEKAKELELERKRKRQLASNTVASVALECTGRATNDAAGQHIIGTGQLPEISNSNTSETDLFQSDTNSTDQNDVSNPPEFSVPETMKPVWEFLPPSTRADHLHQTYIQNVHMVLPLIDLEQYEIDRQQFWNAVNRGGNFEQPDFLLLLFPVLYASVKSLYHQDEQGRSDTLLKEMNQYKTACLRLYTIFDFPNKYSIKILTGFVLLNSVIENPSVTTIAQLTRLCQRARLIKDPALLGINDSRTIQSRRILFWQVFQLDTMTSLHNSLAPLMRLEEFDTSLPVEVINGTLNPTLCYINANYRFVLLLNELCQKKGSFSGIKERIVDLHVCCMGSALSLNNHLSTHSLSFHEEKFVRWAMYMLNTLADRSLLLLHLNIISMSVPSLHNRKLLRRDISLCNDPIVESGYGKDYNVIQTILNNSGNLDLTLHNNVTPRPVVYNFENLTNNLLPASLHFLDEFVRYHSTDKYNCFNWELLVGNMPINAITFVLKMLALDANRAEQMGSRLVLTTDLRFILLSQAIHIVQSRLDEKAVISRHCFHLAKLLFQLLIVRFSNSTAEPAVNKYDISNSIMKNAPQPTLNANTVQDRSSSLNFPWKNQQSSGSSNSTGTDSRTNSIINRSNVPFLINNSVNSSPSPQNSAKGSPIDVLTKEALGSNIDQQQHDIFDDSFFFSGNLLYNSELLDESNAGTTSCAQIAPRTMKAISANEFNMNSTRGQSARHWDDISYLAMMYSTHNENKDDEISVPGSQSSHADSTFSSNQSSNNDSPHGMEHEIRKIYRQVQDYIILINNTDSELEFVASGDEYYREFENALLEVLCGILISTKAKFKLN